MATIWPVGVGNGLLLACYFIPTWAAAVMAIVESPIRGLFERPNIAYAVFFSDTFQLTALGIARLAWLLALGKVVVIAFFAAFVVVALHALLTRRGDCREPLIIALALGAALSFAGLICGAAVGEVQAMRLHATESLMLLGGCIVLLVEDGRRDATGAAMVAPPAPHATPAYAPVSGSVPPSAA